MVQECESQFHILFADRASSMAAPIMSGVVEERILVQPSFEFLITGAATLPNLIKREVREACFCYYLFA